MVRVDFRDRILKCADLRQLIFEIIEEGGELERKEAPEIHVAIPLIPTQNTNLYIPGRSCSRACPGNMI